MFSKEFVESNLQRYRKERPIMFDRYVKFIFSRTQSNVNHKHHILPKSLYPNFGANKENYVGLTYREHFIAHWMLWKLCRGKMTYAFRLMSDLHGGKFRKSRTYSVLMEDYGRVHSERMSGERNPNFGLFGELHPAYGTTWSEDQRINHKLNYKKENHPRWGLFGELSPNFGKTYPKECGVKKSITLKRFYANLSQEERERRRMIRVEIMNRPEVIEKSRIAKLGERNPNYGKDVTNSLSEEANARREANSRAGIKAYHKDNPPWTRLKDGHEYLLLWMNAEDIISDQRGSTSISKHYLGHSKGFNVVLNIKKRAESGWVPSKDPLWVNYFVEPSSIIQSSLEDFI